MGHEHLQMLSNTVRGAWESCILCSPGRNERNQWLSRFHHQTGKCLAMFMCTPKPITILTWIISGICEQENVCTPLWDIRTAYSVFNLTTGRWFAPPKKNHYLPSDFIIHQVSCAGDHTIKIWDLHSKECLATLDEHRDAIRAIQYDESKIVRTLISPSLASLTTKKIGVWVIHKR